MTNNTRSSGLSDIATFVCVVQTGSFTAIAEQLNTSKSVISKYITRLEGRLGVKLLTRTTRRLTLTEIGQTFYDGVSIGIDAIDQAEEEASYLQGKPRGTIKINAPLSFGALHIAPILGEFQALYPEVNVDLRFDDKKVDMVKEGLDLTIRITEQLEGNFIARKIAPCRHAIVAAPSYTKVHGEPKSPEELMNHNVITYQYQHSPWEWEFTASNKKTKRVSVKGDIQMNNSLAIREAVLAGAGIARMPTFVVGEDIKSGRLIRLFSKYRLLELSIYCVFPDRNYMAPKLRAFIDFMVEHTQDHPYWDDF